MINIFSNKFLYIILVVLIISYVLLTGIKYPPKKIKSSDLEDIISISDIKNNQITFSINKLNIWNTLDFRIANESEYPGETPDYIFKLFTLNKCYKAMYNKNDSLIYFSFQPDYSYGWINKPSPGGWKRPLYVTKSDKILLSIFDI